jgi:hypothetical protein
MMAADASSAMTEAMFRLSPTALREYFDRIPTTDLYLLNPLAELRRQGADIPPPRYTAPNVYLVGKTGVIVRYGQAKDLHNLKRAGAKHIVYIVDDDFVAGGTDPSLPERYRLKLQAFAENDWPILKAAADIVIVPGTVVAEIYGAKARIMPPAWDRPPSSTEHFTAAKHIDIVHLGTGSHRSDLALIVTPLARILDRRPEVRLTLFTGVSAPGPLQSHRHVRVRHPLSWWRYKRGLPKMRFHLALYPLAPTAFNNARSANKLYEHALVGAASLMSPNPALRAAAGPEAAARFVDGGAEDWEAQIEAYLGQPDAMRKQVEMARAHIHATDPLAYSALQWRDILAPEI